MLTDVQKQLREGKLGCSDLPVVAGVSPYKTPLALYYAMRGDLPRYNDEETVSQEVGTLAEPMLAEMFTRRTGMKIRRSPTRLHHEHLWLVATLDYEILDTPRGPGVLELKMRDRALQGQWSEGIPNDVAVQVAGQLAVTQRAWARVAVLFGHTEFRIFEIERDKELEQYILDIGAQFLQRVEKGEPPDAEWEKDHSVIKQLFPRDSGAVITLDAPEILTVCQELVEAKAKLKEYEEYKESAEAYLKDQLKTASEAVVPGFGTLTWKNTKDQQRFDVDAFKQAHPLMAADYTKTVPGARRFLMKPKP